MARGGRREKKDARDARATGAAGRGARSGEPGRTSAVIGGADQAAGDAADHAARAGPVRSARAPGPGAACPLCGRPMVPGPSVDLHHPVPRSRGGRDVVLVHRVCHHKIHATFSEAELARDWHDWGRLRDHPEIAAFVQWLRNKPPEFHDRSRRPNRRR